MALKPLLMMRAKGLLSTVFGKHANSTQTLSKSVGQYHGISGTGAAKPILNIGNIGLNFDAAEGELVNARAGIATVVDYVGDIITLPATSSETATETTKTQE